MRHLFLIFITLQLNNLFAQDIFKSQVPLSVIKNFQTAFPKALDEEWEKDWNFYKVEFEEGLRGKEYHAWYDETGKLIRFKEEISKNDLPQKVLEKIKTDFANYHIEDPEKITEENAVFYIVELESKKDELKIKFDIEGNVLSLKND